MIDVNLTRQNTFTEKEYFKILVLSKDKQTSVEQSKWLTNDYKKPIRDDVIRANYKTTSLVCYPRWPKFESLAVNSFEGIYIFVDEEEDFQQISKYIKDLYNDIRPRVLVSNNITGADWAKEIKAVYMNNQNRIKVIEVLDHLDMDYFEYLSSKFNYYDEDKSGHITTNEMEKIASDLGENVKSDNVKSAILAFDRSQDGKISLMEFINWYKIGRKDVDSYTKFFELKSWMNERLGDVFDLKILRDNMNDDNVNRSSKVSNVDISLNTQNIEEYITRINLRAAIGEPSRKEACKNYLSRYNDKMEFNTDYFVDIAIFTSETKINGVSTSEYLNVLKDELISKIDSTFIPGFKSFVDKFIVIHIFQSDFAINLRLEIKYDNFDLFKTALDPYYKIINWLSNNNQSPFDFDFQYYTGKCVWDIVEEGGVLKDFLQNCELKLKIKALKERNLSINKAGKNKLKEYLSFFQPFFVPSTFKMKYEGRVDELNDEKSKVILQRKVDFIKDAIVLLKGIIPEEIKRIMNRLEIGVNIVESFYSVQIFSNHLWH